MKKVFELTNKYIIIATPLILFSLFSSIYLIASTRGTGIIQILLIFCILFLMGAAFIAGWGNMVKSAVSEEKSDEPNDIIKQFPSGVGEYFLSSCGVLICAFLFNLVFFICSFAAGMHYIGDIGVSSAEISKAMANQQALKAFLTGLSPAQLIKINMWNVLLLGTMSITSFLLMLYLPAVFFSSKNPFKALYISIRYIFSNKFFKTLGVFLLIFVLNFVISIFLALLSGNVFTNFVMTLINFYFICCVAIGIFYYYYKHFVNQKPGQIIDTVI